MSQVRDDDGFHHREGSGKEFILKVEPTGFSDGLFILCERKKGGKNSRVFWPEHLEDEVTIY